MPTIAPVSDLRNYGSVLDKVAEGSPVYLTRNGHGAYSIRDMKDEENFQKAEAMIQLLCELNTGIRSAHEEGWVSEEDVRDHFKNMRKDNFPFREYRSRTEAFLPAFIPSIIKNTKPFTV